MAEGAEAILEGEPPIRLEAPPDAMPEEMPEGEYAGGSCQYCDNEGCSICTPTPVHLKAFEVVEKITLEENSRKLFEPLSQSPSRMRRTLISMKTLGMEDDSCPRTTLQKRIVRIVEGPPKKKSNFHKTCLGKLLRGAKEKVDTVLTKLKGNNAVFTLGEGKEVEYVEKSLFCLKSQMAIRQLLVRVINSPWFDRSVLLVILLNSLNMVITLSDPEFSKSAAGGAIDLIFTVCFTLELLVKVLAMGFLFGDGTYLKNAWNILDFIVVVTGLFGSTLGFLRILRLLRPLRTLNKFPGLKTIVETLIRSMPALKDLLILALFVCSIFSIVGMNLMGSHVWNRCRESPSPISPGVWPPFGGEDTAGQLCGGGHECEAGFCGNLVTEGDATPEQAWAEISEVEGAYFGLLGFHDFGSGLLTVFVVSTLEGWNEIAWRYMDSMGGPFPTLFFVLLVLIGNVFIMNLIMAILWEEFAAEEGHDTGQSEEENAIAMHETGKVAVMAFFEMTKNASQMKEELLKRVFSGWRVAIDALATEWAHENFSKLGEVITFCERIEGMSYRRQASLSAFQGTKQLDMSQRTLYIANKCRRSLREFVEHRFFTGFIFALIVANSVILAMDGYPPPPPETVEVITIFNVIFTVAFTGECILKIAAYGISRYLKDGWNVFDAIVVLLSLVEMMLGDSGGSAISAMRSCRLLRVFKMASNLLSLRILLTVLGKATVMCTNFLCVACIFLYIFTLLGMQLFAHKLGSPPPDLHWDDFVHAFTSVFVLVTGEDWIGFMLATGKIMKDEAVASNPGAVSAAWPTTISYFLLTLVVANMVLLQLFMAILGASFGFAREQMIEDYHQKLLDMRFTHHEHFRRLRTEFTEKRLERLAEKERWDNRPADRVPLETKFSIVTSSLRQNASDLISHWAFDAFILFLICTSSVILAVDTPYVDPESDMANVLAGLDMFFLSTFTFEMVLKMFVWGIKGYFKNPWNVLDFVCVMISLLNLGLAGVDLSNLRIFRALRALRPLRLIRRNKGMKILVDALISAIPQILETLVVSILFFFVLAVLAVNLYKGKYWHCSLDSEEGDPLSEDECSEQGGEWQAHNVNFDSIFSAMYALFQMSTNAWTDLMLQAESYTDVSALFFFMMCILVGQFVILNLFIGIIVDEMAVAKNNAEAIGDVFMTKEEAIWHELQKKILASVPIRRKPVAKLGNGVGFLGLVKLLIGQLQSLAIGVVESRRFEILIGFCIFVNASLMCVRHATMSDNLKGFMETCNFWFAMIFSAEAALKLFALRILYFDSAWNRFDFIIVVGTNAFMVVNLASEGGSGDLATLMPVMRCFRVARLLRLARGAHGLSMLFKTMFAVIPELTNVACLLLLIFYIYSILAMGLFGKAMEGGDLGGRVHFHNFGTSLFIWTIVATGNLWDGLVWDCATAQPGCVKSQSYESLMREGPMECGTPVAIPIFVSFQFIGTLVAMNLFVGVVLETFASESSSDLGDTEETLEKFYDAWSEINRDGSRLMDMNKFTMLMLNMPEPVGMKGKHSADLILDKKLRLTLKEVAAARIPGHFKDGVLCVHLHDVMLYIARRCCAWKTRPIAFQYRPVVAISGVHVVAQVQEYFSQWFPEINAEGGGSHGHRYFSGSIVLNNGTVKSVKYTCAEEYACQVLQRRLQIWRFRHFMKQQVAATEAAASGQARSPSKGGGYSPGGPVRSPQVRSKSPGGDDPLLTQTSKQANLTDVSPSMANGGQQANGRSSSKTKTGQEKTLVNGTAGSTPESTRKDPSQSRGADRERRKEWNLEITSRIANLDLPVQATPPKSAQ